MQPLEDAIRHKFALAVTGRSEFSENERQVLSLPARMGGLNISAKNWPRWSMQTHALQRNHLSVLSLNRGGG